MKMNATEWVTFTLVLVGGLNWGLVGFFDYNLVDALFGAGSGASRFVYAIVGLATLHVVYTAKMKKKA